MFIDPKKMKSARERRALTQEALAHQARVNVRTVQRAEGGLPVHAETVAELAAVLGLPPSGLICPGPSKEPEMLGGEPDEGQTQVLKRVERGEIVVSTLERATMAVLGCSAEPTVESMPSLRGLIQALEAIILDPWDFLRSPPLKFTSLLDRLDTVASLNEALAQVERHGMALYMGVSTEYVKVPYGTDEHIMVTSAGQHAQYIRAVRLLVAEYSAERVRVPADVIWPLQLEPDDIPF